MAKILFHPQCQALEISLWLQAFLRILEEGNLRPLWQSWPAVVTLVPHHGSMTNKAMELYLCLASIGSFPYQTVLHLLHHFTEREKPWTAELQLSGDAQTYHLSSAWGSSWFHVTCDFCHCRQLMPEYHSRAPGVHSSSVSSLSKFWLTEWLSVCIEQLMDHTCRYSEVTDSTLYLQFSLISLRLVACNIQKKARCSLKIKKIWFQIFVLLSQCFENDVHFNPVCRQCIWHYFLFSSLAMIPLSRMHAQTMNIFVSIICSIIKYS